MSLNAIEHYVAQNLLTGLVGAYNNVPLAAWTEPPTGQATIETPQAYVLDADGTGDRQTMAGPLGYFIDKHQIHVYLQWGFAPGTYDASLATPQAAFRNLIDTVIAAVRVSNTGAMQITDPSTFQTTQLLIIGDKLTWRYLPQQNIGEGGQEWLLYVAQIVFEAVEKVQYLDTTAGGTVLYNAPPAEVVL